MNVLSLKKEAPVVARPFVKWAGGKRQLLDEIESSLPNSFNNYFEPFVGGGAVFFRVQPQTAFLSDTNADLINTFKVVREDVEALIESLAKHKYEKEYYYELRGIDRESSFKDLNNIERASRFIYLNKSCFNGLYRVNSRGEFNVPFGDQKNPLILDADNLRACRIALQSASINCTPFLHVKELIQKNDLVYIDPPYIPLNETSSFTSYTKDKFTNESHLSLKKFCTEIDDKGAKFILSNSYTTLSLSLYKDFNIKFVKANRAINSRADKRGEVKEILVTNY